MKGRITIEVDFDTRKPFIKIINPKDSDDMRDKMISDFRHQLGGQSSWCKITFPFFSDDRTIEMRIDPIPPGEFAKEIDLMTYEAGRNSNVNPIMKDIINKF
jgi:hypothetical protein